MCVCVCVCVCVWLVLSTLPLDSRLQLMITFIIDSSALRISIVPFLFPPLSVPYKGSSARQVVIRLFGGHSLSRTQFILHKHTHTFTSGDNAQCVPQLRDPQTHPVPQVDVTAPRTASFFTDSAALPRSVSPSNAVNTTRSSDCRGAISLSVS